MRSAYITIRLMRRTLQYAASVIEREVSEHRRHKRSLDKLVYYTTPMQISMFLEFLELLLQFLPAGHERQPRQYQDQCRNIDVSRYFAFLLSVSRE